MKRNKLGYTLKPVRFLYNNDNHKCDDCDNIPDKLYVDLYTITPEDLKDSPHRCSECIEKDVINES